MKICIEYDYVWIRFWLLKMAGIFLINTIGKNMKY